MSAQTFKLVDGLTTPEGTVISGASFSAGQTITVDETLNSTPDRLVNLTFALDDLKLLFILASADTMIETNDGTTPDDVLNLVAGKPLIWRFDGYEDCPLTEDVTAFYVTGACTLTVRAIVDPTP